MKKKISKIWGVGLVVVLIASLLTFAVPVSAATCNVFSNQSLPSSTNIIIGPAGVDVLDIAVANDDTTIYVAAKAIGDANLVYKSTDGGNTWTDISGVSGLGAAITNTQLIAVAPDDPNIVVVVDGAAATRKAFVSTNGGSSFGDIALPAGAFYDVAISPLSGSVRYIAVAGTGGANTPLLRYFNLGAAATSWKDACAAADWTGGGNPANPIDFMRAVEFSPNFASDSVMVAVSEETGLLGGARLHMGSFSCKCWDAAAGFTSWPVKFESNVGAINVARIDLAPDYLAADDSLRLAFIGASITDGLGTGEIGGIYKLSNTSLKDLKEVGIASVGYDGTNLVAGASASNIVYRCADPLATTPDVKSARSNKRPGGTSNVVVAWTGADVVAGTSGDESAFAISQDNGLTFNDVSIIDTRLGILEDVWVTPDSAKIYLLSDDAGFDFSGTVVTGVLPLCAAAANLTAGNIVTFGPGSVDVVGGSILGGAAALAAGTDLRTVSPVTLVAGDQLSVGTTFNMQVTGGVVLAGGWLLTNAAGAQITFDTGSVTAGAGNILGGVAVAAATNLAGNQYTVVAADNLGVGSTVAIKSDLSVWRKASAWQRTLFKLDDTGYIVRGAPEDNDALFVAKRNATTAFYASDSGENKWTLRSTCKNIQDLAVESATVAYVADWAANTVRKSTNSGFTWSSSKGTELKAGNIHTITSIGEDQVIVGGTTGYLSYSTDGNSSWTKITKQLNGASPTQVAASSLDDGGYIYAACDAASTRVERWQIGTSTSWTNMAAPTTADLDADLTNETYGAYGIALRNGALYVACRDVVPTANSAILRNLSPTSSLPAAGHWSSALSAGDTFVTVPSALRTSDPCTMLWAIDTTAPALVSYFDELACLGVNLIAPADGFHNMMCPGTCASNDIAFTWEKPCSEVTAYTIYVYLDKAGTVKIQSHNVSSTSSTVAAMLGPNQALTQAIQYTPGTTYYWKVRVAQAGPVFSPYSELRSFTIEPAVAQQPTILAPANGGTGISQTPSFSWAPVTGATSYHFKIADNVALAKPIADVTVNTTGFALTIKLDYGKTYYWAVKAVAPVEGSWSALANLTVMAEPVAPAAPAPPVVVKEMPAPIINIPAAPAPPPAIVIPPAPAPITPSFIWAIVIIGAILVIAVIVLIVRTRRVA